MPAMPHPKLANFGAKSAKPPAKPEMVANRVVGMVKPSKPEPASDPSMIKPGHHKYV